MQMANNYGGEPFDADVKVSLDEIDSENNNYVVRAYQNINSDQLKTSVLNYLNDLNISQGKELLRFDQFGEMKGEIWIANRIHGSGWTTFSITTKEINFEGEKGIEEFIIKIK